MIATVSPGARIRLHRRRVGLTQEQCAQLKGCTVSAWRKWESGERQVATFEDWIKIARILRVRDLYTLTGLPVGELPDKPAEHDAVPAIRAALVAFDPSGRPSAGQDRPARDQPVDRDRPALDQPVDPDGPALDQAVDPDGPALDQAVDPDGPVELARAVDEAWTLWQERRSFESVGALLPALITNTRLAVARTGGAPGKRLLGTAAMLYFLVRSFTKRVGAVDVSLMAADRAVSTTMQTGDLGYRAAAAWNLGMTLSAQGHTEIVVALARDAIAAMTSTRPFEPPEWTSIYGVLHLLLAVQLGRLGDEHGALAALDVAEDVAGRIGERNDFRTVFGPTNVGIHRVWLALELSRPSEAIRQAQRYDIRAATSVERRFFHYVNLGRAYGMRGEDVAALHMLLCAERESAADLRFNVEARSVVSEMLRRESPVSRSELHPLADRLGVLR